MSRYADGKFDRSTITFHVIFIFLFLISLFFESRCSARSKLFIKIIIIIYKNNYYPCLSILELL